ncbi:hypothetical protein HHK36_015903 [Tetracentron sinense]|uniref:B box-type domain-containing protein n=1 Tax=Tetracentron sinense TaxID=13715 RepID=A0A834Z1W2_TETSI|nr:hypothetical protein HHK36_015903 [Tetracentron sinense]
MENPSKTRTTERIPCDFCSEQVAVLYCRADSAKLCLFCDQHVHSANALSRKHIRSQICDNCSSEPVSVRCFTDNLLLCQECDWDAHGSCSASVSHDRNPVEGFSGCPSPLELASIWGFDLGDKIFLLPPSPSPSVNNFIFPNFSSLDTPMSVDSWMFKSATMNLQDLMVPNENAPIYDTVPSAELPALSKRQIPSCGKYSQVICKQLVELLRRNLVPINGSSENLDSETATRCAQQGNTVYPDLGNGVDRALDGHESLQQETPFTSLLMLPTHMDLRENDRINEGDILWDSNPNDHASQIWDFHLGRSRDHEEPGPLEVGYGASNAGFMIKNYSDLIKETPLATTKVFDDIYKMNCSMKHEDISSQNNNLNNPTASQGPATSESNNIPLIRPLSGSTVVKPKACSGTNDVHFMEQPLLAGGEISRAATTKADMELLAQNRGYAMLRYKEKKKTRRHNLTSATSCSSSQFFSFFLFISSFNTFF